MPNITWFGWFAFEFLSVLESEFNCPTTNGFTSDINTLAKHK
jgi:hypothetical protein